MLTYVIQSQSSVQQVIAMLRSGQEDASIVYDCYERLIEILPKATAAERRECADVLQSLWNRHSGRDRRLLFYLGVLMAAICDYGKSIEYLEQAQKLCGDTANTEFNLGLSYWHLGKMKEAHQCMSQALALDDGLESARQFLRMIDALTGRSFGVNGETEVDATWDSSLRRLENYEFIREQAERTEIYLEPLRPDHAPALYANATPEILRLARVPVISSSEEATDWILSYTEDSSKYGFAITHQTEGFIGVISATVLENGAWFFFWLGNHHWGHGYATAAVSKLMQFIFDGLSLERLFTCVFHYNEPSIRVLEKAGLRRIDTPHPDLYFYHCGIRELSDQSVRNNLQRMLKLANVELEEANQWLI